MKTQKGNSSFPFLSILFLIFLTLKLCNVITWSWWWVTAPLWAGLAIFGVVMVVGVIVLGVTALSTTSRKKN
jgi:hypothetical protein